VWDRIEELGEIGVNDFRMVLPYRLVDSDDGLLGAATRSISVRGFVRVLDTLEKNGLMRRLEDPLDCRAKRLELTDEGRALGLRAERIAGELRDELLGSQDPAGITACINYSPTCPECSTSGRR